MLIAEALTETKAAVAHYRRAVALAPSMAEAHNNLGCALFLLGQRHQHDGCLARLLLLGQIAELETRSRQAIQNCSITTSINRSG